MVVGATTKEGRSLKIPVSRYRQGGGGEIIQHYISPVARLFTEKGSLIGFIGPAGARPLQADGRDLTTFVHKSLVVQDCGT